MFVLLAHAYACESGRSLRQSPKYFSSQTDENEVLILIVLCSMYSASFPSKKMSFIESFPLLQVFFLLIGITWKLGEGYPILNVPDFGHLFSKEIGIPRLYAWLEVFAGVSIESLLNDWPWFSLHLFLYVGQLIPFTIIIINEWPFRTRGLAVARYGTMNFIHHQIPHLVTGLTVSFSKPHCVGFSVCLLWVRSGHAGHFSQDTSHIQASQTLP